MEEFEREVARREKTKDLAKKDKKLLAASAAAATAATTISSSTPCTSPGSGKDTPAQASLSPTTKRSHAASNPPGRTEPINKKEIPPLDSDCKLAEAPPEKKWVYNYLTYCIRGLSDLIFLFLIDDGFMNVCTQI